MIAVARAFNLRDAGRWAARWAIVASAGGCDVGVAPQPEISQEAVRDGYVNIVYDARLSGVDAAMRNVFRGATRIDSLSGTIPGPLFHETLLGARKGTWRFELSADGVPNQVNTVEIPEHLPMPATGVWSTLDFTLADGVPRTYELAGAFLDPNPEDGVVPLGTVESLDGRTAPGLASTLLTVSPLGAPGPFRIRLNVGSDSGGRLAHEFAGTIGPAPLFRVRTTAQVDPILGRPGIASDGTDFLAVWLEGSTVRAGRATASSESLDSASLTLGASPGYPGYPSVAHDGTNYVVVWAADEIRAVRVSSAGVVLDASPIVLTNGALAYQRAPTIAFDGTRYLIAWRTTGNRIRVLRMTPQLVPLDPPAGREIGAGFYPWVAYGAGTFLVAWHRFGPSGDLDIAANRVDPETGVPPDTVGFAVSAVVGAKQDHASVAYGDSVFLVAWHDEREGGAGMNSGGAWGARVSPGGVVRDPSGLRIAPLARDQMPVVAVFDGTRFRVFWQEDFDHVVHGQNYEVRGQAVSTDGVLVGAPDEVVRAPGTQSSPNAAASASRVLVGWGDRNGDRVAGVWARVLRR